MADSAGFKLIIEGSDFSASRQAQHRILELVARMGYSSEAAFGIKLALEESLNNAIRHGNQMDPKKNVHVEAAVSRVQTEIIIEDEGVGFNREVVPDPTLAENLEKCSGRGILLIEAYMDQVEWTKGGRRLRMIKRNEPG